MTATYAATALRRRVFVPAPVATLPPPQHQDPPIYRALMRSWADRGRTLPGRHDPEWARLTAPPTGAGGRLSGSRDLPGDGR
ncbi:hypothetical protein CP978_06715 [Streptomyces nodosus]|uniref:Uncharacterized protein n=1 Tax=Streptomyces nodosus TaxID=40318 RepID=A0A5P2VYN3_9ACTN|nr:hypothetical protein CP978_06715 [Streptomyces nodosus]